MMRSPCLNCTARESGCHGRCEQYAEYAAERHAQREERATQRNIDAAIIEGARKRRRAKWH